MTTIHEEPNGERWMDVAWASVQQEPEWIDCTIGGLLCICGGYVGQLMWNDDAPRHCDQCNRVYRLSIAVETRVSPAGPLTESSPA